jgi:hypothetical protein
MILSKGETIQGTFKLKANDKNERDQDIQISFDFKGEHCAVAETLDYRMC